jgi:hypothetical protein
MKPDLPIACTLTLEELRQRREGLLPGIIARAEAHEPIAGGFRFRFTSEPGLLSTVAAMMEAERRCCRFLHFQVAAEPDEGPIWLEVTGPAGTSEFLAGWIPSSDADSA